MAPVQQPDEPVIVFTVRSLLAEMRDDFRAQLADIARKLDDRPTLGAFRALSSELEAAFGRIKALEDDLIARDAVETNNRRVSDRTLAWAALIVAALGSIATVVWLWIGG